MDGHVDAHAQRVRAADYGEQPLLGELLHQQAVTGQHARMVHAHSAIQQAFERFAESRGEAGGAAGLLNGPSLLLGAEPRARQRLGAREGRLLREMHDVERRLAFADGQLHRALERGVHIFVGQRDGARRIGDGVHGAAGVLFEGALDVRGVSQRGAHQQELRLRQREQRHLPGPAAVGIGEEMELVGGDAGYLCIFPGAQGVVGQNLLRAADDGCVGVDAHVSGDHAHVFAAEAFDQVEELLADQCLDGGRIVAALVAREGQEMHEQRDHALSAARGRAQDDVVACGQRQTRVLLVRPQVDSASGTPLQVGLQRVLRRGRVCAIGVSVPQFVGQCPQRPVFFCVFRHLRLSHRPRRHPMILHVRDCCRGFIIDGSAIPDRGDET